MRYHNTVPLSDYLLTLEELTNIEIIFDENGETILLLLVIFLAMKMKLILNLYF